MSRFNFHGWRQSWKYFAVGCRTGSQCRLLDLTRPAAEWGFMQRTNYAGTRWSCSSAAICSGLIRLWETRTTSNDDEMTAGERRIPPSATRPRLADDFMGGLNKPILHLGLGGQMCPLTLHGTADILPFLLIIYSSIHVFFFRLSHLLTFIQLGDTPPLFHQVVVSLGAAADTVICICYGTDTASNESRCQTSVHIILRCWTIPFYNDQKLCMFYHVRSRIRNAVPWHSTSSRDLNRMWF